VGDRKRRGALVLNKTFILGLVRPLVNKPGGLTVVLDTLFFSNFEVGLYNEGTALVGRTLFYNNLQYSTDLTVGGGAVYNSGQLTLANSTLTGNKAWSRGGGGIWNTATGVAALANVTIAQNWANTRAGGIVNDGSLSMANTILDGNTSTTGNWDCEGTVTATGPNLVSTLMSCSVTGPAPTVGPALLGPLAQNGGITSTHALLNGSPALNAGDAAVCAASPVDGVD